MFSNKFILTIISLIFVVVSFASCSDTVTNNSTQAKKAEQSSEVLDIYKSPTCQCCEKWISHIDDSGFESKTHNFQHLSPLKEKLGVEPRYQSCHTSVSKDGYVFEGHIPAKFIKQFINESHSPDVIGISVPGMPLGSPGMDYGDKFMPYDVLLLKSDGTHGIYASVKSYEEQF